LNINFLLMIIMRPLKQRLGFWSSRCRSFSLGDEKDKYSMYLETHTD